MHWSASVDNEKATALLLKNNAKKDAQDSKVCYLVKHLLHKTCIKIVDKQFPAGGVGEAVSL